jgi:hypothetical protein
MKNDTAMTYMGLGRTKDQNIMRQKALEKYNQRQLALAAKMAKKPKKEKHGSI